MRRDARPSHSHSLQALTAVAGILLLFGVYLLVMRVSVDVSRLDDTHSMDYRDRFYFGLHLGGLVLAAVAGFSLGKWLNGLGLGYAVLFVVVLAVLMVWAQMGSYALACNGHNDVIRHWTC